MKMTFSKSQFDVPEGKYLAQFVGTKMLEDKGMLGDDGKPLPPAMAWEFQIIEGEHAGKKADRVTGRQPTPKSGCGKMLAALTDQILKDGSEYDIEPFTGKLYRITIEEKPKGNGTRVSDSPPPVRVYDTVNATTPGKPPPPPSKSAKLAEPTDESQWQFYDDNLGEYVPMSGKEVRAFLGARQRSPDSVHVTPVGSEVVKTAAEYGFQGIPF